VQHCSAPWKTKSVDWDLKKKKKKKKKNKKKHEKKKKKKKNTIDTSIKEM